MRERARMRVCVCHICLFSCTLYGNIYICRYNCYFSILRTLTWRYLINDLPCIINDICWHLPVCTSRWLVIRRVYVTVRMRVHVSNVYACSHACYYFWIPDVSPMWLFLENILSWDPVLVFCISFFLTFVFKDNEIIAITNFYLQLVIGRFVQATFALSYFVRLWCFFCFGMDFFFSFLSFGLVEVM